jgi:uncharacterized damage-inducible protein DinB
MNNENGYMQGIALDKWDYQDLFEGVTTKDELIKVSNEREKCGQKCLKTDLKCREGSFEPEQSHFARLQYALENEIHHRGQGYTYLRMLGIEPPEFYVR